MAEDSAKTRGECESEFDAKIEELDQDLVRLDGIDGTTAHEDWPCLQDYFSTLPR